MHRRLEQAALRADLLAVHALLEAGDRATDPIGWMQFSYRKEKITKELQEISESGPSKSVAMLFGGRPVVGSRGISADFTSKMIMGLQTLVSTHSASSDGVLGERGPVPQRAKSQMLVTDVARGSFGFVLEGDGQVDSELTESVEAVCILLSDMISDSAERFISATDGVDARILPALRTFFRTLDENGATLRILTDDAEFSFDREEIERARSRIDTLQVSEPYTLSVKGRIFTVPDSKRFELFPLGGAPVIKGSVSASFVKTMFEENALDMRNFNGKVTEVVLNVKETTLANNEIKKAYSLVDIPEFTN